MKRNEDASIYISDSEEGEFSDDRVEDKKTETYLHPSVCLDVTNLVLAQCRCSDLYVMRAVDHAFHQIVHSRFTSTDDKVNPSKMHQFVQTKKLGDKKQPRVGGIRTIKPGRTRYTLPFYATDALFHDFFQDGAGEILKYFIPNVEFVSCVTLHHRYLKDVTTPNVGPIPLPDENSTAEDSMNFFRKTSRYLNTNEMVDNNYWISSARGDSVLTFKFFLSRFGVYPALTLIKLCAKHGSISMLEYLYHTEDEGCDLLNFSCENQVENGSLTEDRWKQAQMYAIGISEVAAAHGQLSVLKWCHRHHIPFGPDVPSILNIYWKEYDPEKAMEIFTWFDTVYFSFPSSIIGDALEEGNLFLARWLWSRASKRHERWTKAKNRSSIEVEIDLGALMFIRSAVIQKSEKDQLVAMEMLKWLVLDLRFQNPIFSGAINGYDSNRIIPILKMTPLDLMVLSWAIESGFPVQDLVSEAAKFGVTCALKTILDQKLLPAENLAQEMENWKAINREYHQNNILPHRDLDPETTGDNLAFTFASWVNCEKSKLSSQKSS